ncbi:hypothetical protein [Litorisediminicola beolgyonensis]|uniref:Glycosyltransferase n=1 Tax=Litorisediminicola beolgyonensis TaxID=1173614 RepID=A0ABW3ZFU9_9RHOB
MKLAIITPVGPGHADLFASECAPSVKRAQEYSTGPFTEIRHLRMDDTEGKHGRSRRRNTALKAALADGIDWVFFLDADDLVAANAFDAFGRVIAAEPHLDAVWGVICEQDEFGEVQLRPDQPERLDSRDAFLATHPAYAVQIGGFVRTAVAATIGFETGMDTGEDYRFYRALWNGHRCAKRPEIFFVNRRGQHSTGPRSATGRDWVKSVEAQRRVELGLAPIHVPVEHAGTVIEMRVADLDAPDTATLLEGRLPQAEFYSRIEAHLPMGLSMLDICGHEAAPVLWALKHMGAVQVEICAAQNSEALADLARRNGVAARLKLQDTQLVAAGGPEAPAAQPESIAPDLVRLACPGRTLDRLAALEPMIAKLRPALIVEAGLDEMLPVVRDWARSARYRVSDSLRAGDRVHYFFLPQEQRHAR